MILESLWILWLIALLVIATQSLWGDRTKDASEHEEPLQSLPSLASLRRQANTAAEQGGTDVRGRRNLRLSTYRDGAIRRIDPARIDEA